MTYKCLIAENNESERDLLQLLIEDIEQLSLVAACADGMAAIQVLMDEQVDIVFTDVDMPGLSGINLLKSLTDPPIFIFISAFSNYAVDGFELDIADFILKPVSIQRLLRAFGKAKELIALKQKAVPAVTGATDADTFFVRTSNGILKLSRSNIIYASSKENFSVLHTTDGLLHMVLVGLKQLEEQLSSPDFIRIHRYTIINWQHVTLINADTVTLADTHQLDIGSTYKNALTDKLANHTVLKRK